MIKHPMWLLPAILVLASCTNEQQPLSIVGKWALDSQKTFNTLFPFEDPNDPPMVTLDISETQIRLESKDGQSEIVNYKLIAGSAGVLSVEGTCNGNTFVTMRLAQDVLVLETSSCADYPAYCAQIEAGDFSRDPPTILPSVNRTQYFRPYGG